MYKLCHQEFLLDCDYPVIVLDEFYQDSSMHAENALTVSLSDLDMNIGSEEHWYQFLAQIPEQVHVILINDRPLSSNPIYNEFSLNTIKAYIYRLRQARICCKLTDNMIPYLE